MKRLAITLLGHKDHGKSTLIGRLLFDTKSVMEDRVEEVMKHSKILGRPFEYAFLLDSFEEERRDGMTIDVIHAQVKGKKHLYDCIDVPGHRELLKNMLSGASHADAGILIVSAKEGLEEQTGHHLRLAHWLGLDSLMIVVNKMDLVGYSQQMFETVVKEVESLRKTFFLLPKVEYIPISAYEGDNVVNRSQNMGWYSGRTLFEQLELLERQNHLSELSLRLPVQDVYEKTTGEKIIAGRIESGKIHVGQQVLFVPSREKAMVMSILTTNECKTSAVAGENIGMIIDRDLPSIKRGEICCTPEDSLNVRKEITAHAILLEDIPQQLVVECGPSETECVVEAVVPASIGEVSTLRFRFKNPMIVERAKTSLGRLAIKKQGKIVGVAVAV
ncbi:MAG: 50S ribosome-binding GTPase [Nitrospirae bacterium]|nr:50S ribosome-binding GTPase [Nitrospirota bacterium]